MSSTRIAIHGLNERRSGKVISVAGKYCIVNIGGINASAVLAAGVKPSVGDTVSVTNISGQLTVEVVTDKADDSAVSRKRPLSSASQDTGAEKPFFSTSISVAANSTYVIQHGLGRMPNQVLVWHDDGSSVLVLASPSIGVSLAEIKIVTGSYVVDNDLRQSTSGTYHIIVR